MTREEAIKWLRLDIDMMKFDPSTGADAYLNDDAWHVIEAQEMAIDALKQPECEDAVSRKAVIDFVNGITNLDPKAQGSIVLAVKFMPSVTPKRKTGKWIIVEGFDGDEYYKCSECGKEFVLIDGTPGFTIHQICPIVNVFVEEMK